MQTKNIRHLIVLGTMMLTGIIIIQIYWIKKAFDVQEKQFSHSVQVALSTAAYKAGKNLTTNVEVEQVSSAYYVVNLNGIIDTSLLGNYLTKELLQSNIKSKYELGIYDSIRRKLLFSKSSLPLQQLENHEGLVLSSSGKNPYYLGVHFPNKNSFLANGLYIWIFSSIVLLILVAFFAYSMFVIFKQKKLSEVQKDFVNNMTHEFRTPLTTISLSAETIINHPSIKGNKEMITFSKIISEEVDRLNNQVEKILQMSKSESGKIKLLMEKIDLHQLVEDTINRFPPFLQEKVTIDLQLCAEDPIIFADKVHLSNVLFNLIDNAYKYSVEKAKICIATKMDKQQLIFSVSDDGIGIQKKYRQKIFENFYRVPTGNVHNVKGFGIGLSYVKNIIKAHNWNIQLWSMEMKGSKFTIYIPNY